ELVAHVVVVGAVVQPLARLALVEVAVAGCAVYVVADHEYRHRRGEYTGHRAHAAMVMARPDDDVALVHAPIGVSAAAGQALVHGGVDQRGPLTAGVRGEWHRGPRRQNRPVGHARYHVPRCRHADQHWLGLAHAPQRGQIGVLARGRGYHAAVP